MRISNPMPTRPHTQSVVAIARPRGRTIPLIGGFLLAVPFAFPAEAQLLRGALDTTGSILGTGVTVGTTSPGNGVLGTGLNVATTGGSVLGTGLTVGTTNPGRGVLGTGLTVGTTGNGVLGTGLTVGTTGPGDGLLGTGLTLGTAGSGGTGPIGGCPTCPGGGGTGGQGVYIVTGNVTQSQSQTIVADLRLSQISNVTAVNANNTSALAAPVATGGDALAVGYGATATGASATAIGTGSSAANAGSVAVGYGASSPGAVATAVGTGASATGAGSSAYGYAASASGAGATAIGVNASAAGNGSVALGNGAAANQSNTTAIGNSVQTTRADQVAIGNANNTYTFAGIASQASASAQSGATNFVTTDAGGNLAASQYGPSTIAALGNRVDSAEARIGSVENRVGDLENKTAALGRYAIESRKEARQGAALAIAMATAPLPSAPGKTTWATNVGTYRGEWAGGIALAHRLPTCCVPIAVTVGYAYAGDNNHGVRAGLAGEF